MQLALHRVRCLISPACYLDLEVAHGKGAGHLVTELPAGIIEAEEEALQEVGAGPALWLSDEDLDLFEPLRLRENTDYYIDAHLPIALAEAKAKAAESEMWPFGEKLRGAFKRDPVRRWRQHGDGTTTITGLLRAKNAAGILDLSISQYGTLRCDVFSSKLDYATEFRLLLTSLATKAIDLCLQYDAPTSVLLASSYDSPGSDFAALFYLRSIFDRGEITEAIDLILDRPHSRLLSSTANDQSGTHDAIDLPALAAELAGGQLLRGGPLKNLFRGHTPTLLPCRELTETQDTDENRFVKYFLEELLRLLYDLRDRFVARGGVSAVREIARWTADCEELVGRREWREIGPFRKFPANSQVLQYRAGYRDILRIDQLLKAGLQIRWQRSEEIADGFDGDVRPLPELYEYWCFFVLYETLAKMAVHVDKHGSNVVEHSESGLRLRLRRGFRSRISFLLRQEEAKKLKVDLFYNKRFVPLPKGSGWHGSYTARFTPDYSMRISVEVDTSVTVHWLHFDAKYRAESTDLDPLTEKRDSNYVDNITGEYDLETSLISSRLDLFKMHTYRDGILGSRGAYVLYPGDRGHVSVVGKDRNVFVRRPGTSFNSTVSSAWPSVGSFALRPEFEERQQAALMSFLDGLFTGMFESSKYNEESGPE